MLKTAIAYVVFNKLILGIYVLLIWGRFLSILSSPISSYERFHIIIVRYWNRLRRLLIWIPKFNVDNCFILCSLILVVAVFIWVYDWYAGRPRPRSWGRTPVTVCTWWTVWRWRSPVQRRPSKSCSKVKHWPPYPPKIILGVWLWHTVKTPEHQHFLIYLIRKNKSMIYTIYTIFYFTYLKKNSLWVKYVWEYTCIIIFFFNTR